MTTLFQLDSKNKTRVWQIEVRGSEQNASLAITTGLLDGKHTTSLLLITGKNTGKRNQTSSLQQAFKELDARVKQQLRKGYVDSLDKLKPCTELGSGLPAPMLAQKYDPTGKQKGSKTLAKLGLENKKVIVQPKYDGNRCLIKITVTNHSYKSEMFTREGDLMPVQLLPILHDISVAAAYVGLKESIILDGELYSELLSFNKQNGLLKKVDPSPEQIAERESIKFRLYDVLIDEPYDKRLALITPFANETNIFLTPSYEIVATYENLLEYLEKFLALGYEGLMIRILDKGYENKRSWSLLKYKVFEDEEFVLSGFKEDKRGGFVGAYIMLLPEPVKDRDGKTLTTFKAGASGQSQQERTEMWKHPEKYIGRVATIKFFGRSEYGLPRFGKLKGFR